jgi:hypothetical protein
MLAFFRKRLPGSFLFVRSNQFEMANQLTLPLITLINNIITIVVNQDAPF